MSKQNSQNSRAGWVIPALMASIAALPLGAEAAGLGKLTLLSALGQPLRAELDISASREEMGGLSARVAPAEAFRQANIEYSGLFATLKFSLDTRSNGQPYFRITSDRAISDPFLDLLVELSWSSGRLVREYTFLLDPPEMNKPAETVPVTNVTLPTPTKREGDLAPVSAGRPKSKGGPKVAAELEKSKPAASTKVAAEPSGAKVPVEVASTHEVKAGDTLAKIAAQTKPSGVNLEQMLVALFQANPDAFGGGNMNRLKAGQILNVPAADTVGAVSPAEAHKVIVAQSADFDSYKRKLAGGVANGPAVAASAGQVSSGKITPKVEDKGTTLSAKDRLQVSQTEVGKGGTAAQGKANEEDRVAREKALKEAQSRIVELEKNLSEMRKLAEMKSQAAAEMQKQAAAAKSAPSAAVAPPPAPAPKVEANPPASTVEPPKPVEPPKVEPPPPAPAAPASPPAAEAPKPVPQPAPKPVAPPPPPEPEPSFMDENGGLVFGGAGVFALLLGFLGFKAWKRKKENAQPAPSESALSGTSAFSASTTRVDTDSGAQASEFGDLSEGFGAGEGVDPVREAETYMAYGRDVQAEEILLDALKKDPTNLALHVKLLEIYATRKSVPQFNTLASDLHGQTEGKGPEWEKVAALGRDLDGGNPLYGGGQNKEEAPAVEISPYATTPIPMPPEAFTNAQANKTVIIPSPGGTAAAVAKMPIPEQPAEPVAVAGAAAEEEIALDFDLDLGAPGVDEAAPVATEVAAGNELDFDLDLGASDAPAVVAADVPAAVPAPDLALDFDLNLDAAPAPAPADAALDFELASTDITGGVSEAPIDLAAENAPAVLDFDLDLPESGQNAEVTSVPVVAEGESVDFSLASTSIESVTAGLADSPADLSDALDLALPADEGDTVAFQAASEPVVGLPTMDGALEHSLAETLIAPAPLDISVFGEPQQAVEAEQDSAEVNTKLELALAYEEMGDKEGAKELLLEVLNEGSSSQREIAKSRMEKLS